MGAYEALHVRDSEKDEKISAVYMTPDGFVATEADCINIHTRTGNHVAGKGMWSAGCMLVGDRGLQPVFRADGFHLLHALRRI